MAIHRRRARRRAAMMPFVQPLSNPYEENPLTPEGHKTLRAVVLVAGGVMVLGTIAALIAFSVTANQLIKNSQQQSQLPPAGVNP